MRNSFETPESVTVTTAFTSLAEITGLDRQPYLNVEIENPHATKAWSDFKCQIQDHPDGEWYDYVTTWAALSERLLVVTGAPATLAGLAFAHATLFIGAAYGIRFQAKVAADTGNGLVRGASSFV